MEYTITGLTQLEVQVVMAGLGEIPLKVAAAPYSKIKTQVDAQDKAAAIPIGDLLNPGQK